jgi:hypothetical protein
MKVKFDGISWDEGIGIVNVVNANFAQKLRFLMPTDLVENKLPVEL